MTLKNKFRGIKEIWRFDNRWQILFSRMFFPGEKICIYRYKDLEIVMDHSAGDANGAREVLTTDMYRRFLGLMKLGKELQILDLGSNNGGFPLLIRSEQFEISHLVCVEFNPETFSRLRFNIERNFRSRCDLLNLAVCGSPGEFEVGPGNGGTSASIYQETSPKPDARKIAGETFDEIYTRTFGQSTTDICKMDIEGAEFEIFESGTCQMLKMCRYLLIEIHHESGSPRDEVRQKLGELGFVENDPDSKSDSFHHVHFFVNTELE